MSIGFKIKDGVMLKYEGTDSVVVIPEGVEKIGEKGKCQECKMCC